ncbi:vascular endothelial growth factor C-like, partial [Saccostrea cucullata]|uniref:vascular endothelial growth factor C-like n=1 Tax=Saccostrea cuccullata TaxID=36930 RepID=UPI002ED4405A
LQPDYNLLKNITRTQDFAQFIRKDGRPLNFTELFNSDANKQLVGGTVSFDNLAQYDYCSPRYQTVVIPRDTDPSITYFPPCTRVLRCGGCAPAEVLSCEPRQTSIKQVVVVRSRIPYPGSPDTVFEALEPKDIVQHDSCEPHTLKKCKVKPEHCNPVTQAYVSRDCSCICRNRRTCPTDLHVWDEDTCTCKCAQKNDNCPGFSRFSEDTCRCELRHGVSGMTDEEIRNLLQLAAQVTTTTTPAPTTPAPNLPPLILRLPNSPCQPAYPCPIGTSPKISPVNGRCQCMLPQFRLPPLRRRRQIKFKQRLLRNRAGLL